VTANEPFFQGHFPHHAVMPGVLIIEAMAQAAAMLGLLSTGQKNDGKSVYYFVGIDGARFKRPVRPRRPARLRGGAAAARPRDGQVQGRGEGRREGRLRSRAPVHAQARLAGRARE